MASGTGSRREAVRAPTAEAVSRHPHLSEKRRPGSVRVDCHVHTMWSGDSSTTPDEIAGAIVSSAIDVVCITDHSTITGALRLAAELPCRVVVGQEQRSSEGELIGLFLTERISRGARSAREVAAEIRAQGGLVYVPHPFDPSRHHIAADVLERLSREGLIDVIEARNAKTSLEHLNDRAAAAARLYGVAAGAGSDAHVGEAIGAAYVEVADFSGRDEFIAALAGGSVAGHHFDESRPWRTRVVPSLSALRPP